VVQPIFDPCVWRREVAARGGRPLVRMTGGTGRGGGRRKRNRSRPRPPKAFLRRRLRSSTSSRLGCSLLVHLRSRLAVSVDCCASGIVSRELASSTSVRMRATGDWRLARPDALGAALTCLGVATRIPAFRDRSRCSRRLRAARSGSLRRSVGRSRTRRNRGDLSHLPGTAAQLTRSRVGRIYIMCPGAGRRALVRLGYSRTGQLRSQRLGRSMLDGASSSSNAETSRIDRSD
jgi:hypothetical protein